jgi:hypothetical protein
MPASTKHAPSNDERENLSPPIIHPKATVYSRHDSVLGASVRLKHFGMRRLGRTGLSNRPPLADPASPTDNVRDVNCSSFFRREVDGAAIHGAYFVNEGILNLMRHVLRGLDRGALDRLGYTKGATWP